MEMVMPHFTDKQIGIQPQRGFSLIEAMFSALILAVALLGLAGFQAVAMKDGSLVKARSVAANLAQEKLDDLRSYATLDAFDAIAEDEGGVLSAGTVDGYTDNYERTWTVACATESAGAALNFGNTCTGAVAKLATVTISWTDSKGDDQSVSLQGVIYAMDPYKLALSAASAFSTQKPKVSYTPIGVPDAVPVPINTGTGEYKESSKPVPDVVSNDTGAEVSFDAVSYSSNGTGGYDTTAKEEFVTTSCECEFSGSGTGEAYVPSRMVWNGTALKAKIGDQISKTVGQVASNGQSDLCNACCKDHHDVAGTSQPKYDPDRDDSEYTGGGDHKHYWYTLCTSGTTGSTSGCNAAKKDLSATGNGYSEVSSGAYLESCRFKRVDGFWRLWQDWRQVKMTVIPYDYLLTTTNLNAYVDVIEAVVENTIRTDSGNGSTSIPTLSNRDIEFTAAGEVKQLLGRAVYVDRIYEADDPATLDAAYYDKLVELIGADSDWLNHVPFYEANLTLLIDWSSSNDSKATVTSQTIVDINDVSSGYYNSYSRGKVTAVAAGSETITATARLHNTGVTGGINTSSPSYGISGYDNIVTDDTTDFITVSLAGTPGSVGFSGKFVRSNASVNFSTMQIAGATCTLQTAIGNELPFTCTVTSGSSPTLSYSSSGSGYTFSPSSESFTNVTTAVTAQTVTVYGPNVKISGALSEGTGNPNMNKVNVSAVSASGTTTTCTVTSSAYTCTVPRGASGYTGALVFSDTDNSSVYTFSTVSSLVNQQADVVANVVVTKP